MCECIRDGLFHAIQFVRQVGLVALVVLGISGCMHSHVPLRYRCAAEAQGYSIVVSEWGVLEGTDPEGEKVEVYMQGSNGREYECHFEAWGHVVDSWCADLDADGKPEVVIITESYGTGSYGEVRVVKMTTKGLITLRLPVLSDVLDKGYWGHDVFQRGSDRSIIRTFPVYLEDDGNVSASGGTRMIVYAFRNNVLVIAETRDFPPVETGSAATTNAVPAADGRFNRGKE
jgi:hypothetical protein